MQSVGQSVGQSVARSVAIVALGLMLTACGQSGVPGFAHPPANPPSVQTRPVNPPQAQALTPQQKSQLEDMVRRYLDEGQQNGGQGFQRATGFNDEVTNLQPGTDHRYQVTLTAGTSYRIVGSCDQECSNLDIELIDAGGSVVANDMTPGDFPVVSFIPQATGSYTVRMLMQTCTAAPCYAASRVLTQVPGASTDTTSNGKPTDKT